MIPHPAAKGIGLLLQLPDIGNDLADLQKDPSIGNFAHVILDGLQFIPGLTKVVSDDKLALPGMIDDIYQATQFYKQNENKPYNIVPIELQDKTRVNNKTIILKR